MNAFWLGLAILFVIIECITTQFLSIWFALGAIIALGLSLFHQSLLIQLAAFIITGLGLAVCLHPWIKRKLVHPQALNVDGLVGKQAIVNQNFSNGEGRVIVDHLDWKAKSNEELKQGDTVQIIAVNGVTLTVSKKREEEEQWSCY